MKITDFISACCKAHPGLKIEELTDFVDSYCNALNLEILSPNALLRLWEQNAKP